MTVGKAAHAAEALGGMDEVLALQGAADEVDGVVGEVGDVAEGLVLDLAVFPVASPEEVGAVDLVLVLPGRGGYVNCA